MGKVNADATTKVALLSVAILALAGCTSSESYGSGQIATCDDVFQTALSQARAGDTADSINERIDWLSSNCESEADVLIGYISTMSMPDDLRPDDCAFFDGRIPAESIDLLRADGLCGAVTADVPVAAPEPEAQPGGGIAWNEAAGLVGTDQRVCGPLVNSGTSDDDVFLNLGRGYPDASRFTIVIWDIGGIEPIEYGLTLFTSGVITSYEGVAQIELYAAEQVKIYG